ncbi:MAG TPA: hypothetical protein VD996_09225 [Chitinophagaceae bacterium]|nr:hypothetical protein [Chitinophagaceae bacterium]
MKPITKLLVAALSFCLLAAACKKSNQKENAELKEILKNSVQEQFGTADFTLREVKYETHEGAEFTSVSYRTINGESGSAMVVTTAGKPVYVNAQALEANRVYLVDCKGSCGCTERYIPASNSVECTCTPCTMRIIEIQP